MAENKKDAFTFSDKIKNSKPAFNPFSKRVSSKIGNNGKPKKTLFERTRRDAPFFIAAIAALLVLPFLYKYSGSVEDEGAIVSPGMSDTVFDPERFDFLPSMEDPSGQIAQLAGRDPLSLIKGWDEETTTRYAEDRDALADYSTRPSSRTSSVSSSYRRTAPTATRAAFQRTATPTKVNELRGASLYARGGGNIGGHFGGANLKNAANKSSAGPVRNPTKPVSLQPLRAAGAPSRSYYGQDGVKQARASLDNMSKSDAALALRDSVFTPVTPGHVGGLSDGLFAAGGGSGKPEHNMDYKGITPWWWDLMKQRDQEKWNFRYHLWRDPLKTSINTWFPKVLNCLAVGDPDGDLDNFWGVSGEPSPAGCKYSGTVWTYAQISEQLTKQGSEQKIPREDKFESWCTGDGGKDFFGGSPSWVKGYSGSDGTGFFSQRLSMCTGRKWWQRRNSGKDDSGNNGLDDRYKCESVKNANFADGINFELVSSGSYADKPKVITVAASNDFIMPGTNQQATLCGNAKSCVVYAAYGDQLNPADSLDWDNARKEMIAMLEQKFPGSGEAVFTRLLFQEVDGAVVKEKSTLPQLPAPYEEFHKALKEVDNYACGFPPFQIKAGDNEPDKYIAGTLVYNSDNLNYDDIEVNCASEDSSTKVGPLQPGNGAVFAGPVSAAEYNCYDGMDDNQKNAINGDFSDGQASFLWTAQTATHQSADRSLYNLDENGQDDVDPNKCTADKEGVQEINGINCQILTPCLDGVYGTPQVVDPNPACKGDRIVDKISGVALNPDLAKDPNARLKPNSGNTKWPSCKVDDIGSAPLLVTNARTVALVAKAAALYEQQTGNALVYDPDALTVANVLDAIMILGENSVPKNTVCMLGKTLGASSKDPHAPGNNMFGVFAAFVNADSSYFPTNRLSNGDIDPRFHGCRSGKTAPGFSGNGNAYHYGHYNWSWLKVGDLAGKTYRGKHSQDGRKPYETVLSNGPWAGAPLAALTKNAPFRTSVTRTELRGTNGTIDDINRKVYQDAYANVFWGNGDCDYDPRETMSVQGLFDYISALCDNGSDLKPANAPDGQSLDCSLHQYQISQVKGNADPVVR